MVRLKQIGFVEFEDDIYKHYKELFPKEERQPLELLKKLYEKGILKFVKIKQESLDVGFLIYVTVKKNPYVWLDYFAIYKEFQNKKYGTEAICLFKEYFTKYDGIYGEVEKIGNSIHEEENCIRKKRMKFWTSLGFELLHIDASLFGVVYSTCVLKLKYTKRENKKILEYGFQLYEAVMGKEAVANHCFLLEN